MTLLLRYNSQSVAVDLYDAALRTGAGSAWRANCGAA